MNLLCTKLLVIYVSLAVAASSAAILSGCSSDDSSGNLPMVECVNVPSYSQVTMLTTTCTTCHSSTLSGAARTGAPPTINFDTYAGAVASADEAAFAVYRGTMPPSGASSIPEADKEKLYVWAQCGTPP
jgi:uncharacterized membrane protein